MTDEHELDERELLGMGEGLKRIAKSKESRGYAPAWHAGNKYQAHMEVDAVREWAEVMNDRGWRIDIHTVHKNPCEPPDCLAEMDEKTIGVEVTELVCREAIEDKTRKPGAVLWNREAFRMRLNERVRAKDKPSEHVSKQVLLILTDEPALDEAMLCEYLKTIELKRPRHFDGIYVMRSYEPNPAGKGHGHYPLFEVSFAGQNNASLTSNPV